MRPKRAIRKFEDISRRLIQEGFSVSDYETQQVLEFYVSVDGCSYNVSIWQDPEGTVTVDTGSINNPWIKSKIAGTRDDNIIRFRNVDRKTADSIQVVSTRCFSYPMRSDFPVKIWLPADVALNEILGLAKFVANLCKTEFFRREYFNRL